MCRASNHLYQSCSFSSHFQLNIRGGTCIVLMPQGLPNSPNAHTPAILTHCRKKIANDHKVTFIVKNLGSLMKIVFMAGEYLHSPLLILCFTQLYCHTVSEKTDHKNTSAPRLPFFPYKNFYKLNILSVDNLLYFLNMRMITRRILELGFS